MWSWIIIINTRGCTKCGCKYILKKKIVYLQDLIKRYAAELVAQEEDVLYACENLRTHAVNKLSARTKFQSTGIATVKVKIAAGAGTSAVSICHKISALLPYIVSPCTITIVTITIKNLPSSFNFVVVIVIIIIKHEYINHCTIIHLSVTVVPSSSSLYLLAPSSLTSSSLSASRWMNLQGLLVFLFFSLQVHLRCRSPWK
jgi:hypothetical protein